jgi:tripeptidyl-peptidase-2
MGPLIEQTIEEDADGNKSGYVLGVGGKRLTVNLGWKNPSGTYRVGIKRASELYPNGLKSRIEEERKRIWMNKHKNLEARLQQELSNSVDSNNEDLKARISLVKSYEKEWDDPGPIYDCLVFHDGEQWNAIVDTTESGDVSGLQPMRNYAYAREYRRFSDLDALNFAVNIFDNGDILSIVVDAGAHGSHVAGIVSAFHPDHPELNGIAPGAQIVSLKIGNSRLGSMETGPGLIRALLEAVRRGCHIINMSYGEAAAQDNSGAFIQLAETLVKKYGIVFVGSAGNNGPALSTMGAPCGTSSAIIGVGAMVTQSLINAAYSSPAPGKLKETNYTWSSMGPTIDGHRGVSVLAPGGAITSVPLWTLSRNQLMNGTSMAAPNATGCISLLLSAAKASAIPKHKLNPLVIRKIIENSALRLPNVEDLGQGAGLIQVKKAWDTIVAQFIPEQANNNSNSWVDVSFDVKVHSSRFSRGIYLRQPIESNSANTFKVFLLN